TMSPARAMTSAARAIHTCQSMDEPYWLTAPGGGWGSGGFGAEAGGALVARAHADLAVVERPDPVHVGADVVGEGERGAQPGGHHPAVDVPEGHVQPGVPGDPVEARLPVLHGRPGALGGDDEVGPLGAQLGD